MHDESVPLLKYFRSLAPNIRYLLLYHLAQGVGVAAILFLVFFQLFVELPVNGIPLVLGGSALLSLVISRIYAFIERQTQPHYLLKGIVITMLMVAAVLMFFPIKTVFGGTYLVVSYGVFWGLDNLNNWGISEKVYSPVSHKQLYRYHQLYRLVGRVVGYTLTLVCMLLIGTEGLPYIAVTGFGCAFFALQALLKLPEVKTTLDDYFTSIVLPERDITPDTFLKTCLKNRYFLIIALLLLLVSATFTLTLIQGVSVLRSYSGAEEVISLFCLFLLITTYAISTALYAVRKSLTLNFRFNILNTLLCIPLATGALLLLSVPVYFLLPQTDLLMADFALIILVFILAEGLSFSSLSNVLLYPLKPIFRSAAYTTLVGLFVPAGTGIVCVSLLAFHWVKFTDHYLSYVGVSAFLLSGWVLVAWRVAVRYTNTIRKAVKLRNLERYELAAQDEEMLEVLHEKVYSAFSEEIIYALDVLGKLNVPHFALILKECLSHEAIEVRLFALETAKKHRMASLVDEIYFMVQYEEVYAVRQEALQCYFYLKNPDIDEVRKMLSNRSVAEEKLVLMAALSEDLNPEVKELLEQYLQAFLGDETDIPHLILAIEVIAEGQMLAYVDKVGKLLKHKNTEVRYAAIQACAELKAPAFIPGLLLMLQNEEMTKEVKQVLVAYGEMAFPSIDKALAFSKREDRNYPLQLCQIVGRIGGKKAQEILWGLASYPWQEMQINAYEALRKSRVNVQDKVSLYYVCDHLEGMFKHIAWLYQALRVIENNKVYIQLAHALKSEIRITNRQIDILYYILLEGQGKVYESMEEENFFNDEEGDNEFIREDIENRLLLLLPRDIAEKLTIVRGFYTNDEKAKKLSIYYSYQPQDDLGVVSNILKKRSSRGSLFNRWTIASALYSVSEIASPGMLQYFSYYLQRDDLLLIEPALSRLVKYSIYRGFDIERLLEEIVPEIRKNLLMSILNNDTKPLMQIEKIIILKSTRLFADISERALMDVADIVNEERYNEGDHIYFKGDLVGSMFVIYEGEVQMLVNGDVADTLINRDVFGELELLDSLPSPTMAVASRDTILLRIDRDDFYDLMEAKPEIMHKIVFTLCARLREYEQPPFPTASNLNSENKRKFPAGF
ncbi:cyclic nucleotide-binding domain-containing protein [Limibacter armeniacum]|uniref:cyclic nucleotide-binding domain-containing protein n=1 Tax=Limibacter armeniacum TaxID=466084 RepID=UPI002FE63C71